MDDLTDDIFIIEKFDLGDGQVSASLTINKNSAIFKGHFPGQPVVPGACMVQLVKDALFAALKTNVSMKKAATIKFISMMTPDVEHLELRISYKIDDGGDINVNAKITTSDVACFKLQATYAKL